MDQAYIERRADEIVKALAAAKRATRAKALNAFCSECGTEILDTLLYAAHDGFEMPGSVTIECPRCEARMMFYLEWSVEVVRAELIDEP